MAADNSHPDSQTSDFIKQWDKDHIQGGVDVIIRPARRTRAVSFIETSDTRTTVAYAIEELENIFRSVVHGGFERLAADATKIGMPPDQAIVHFQQETERLLKDLEDRWCEKIRELIVAKTKEMDQEFERKFTEDEVKAFHQRFRNLANPISQAASAAFRVTVWDRADDSQPSPIPSRTPDLVLDSEAARRRLTVGAYIEEVFRLKQKRITRTDIWKLARYKSRTEFERWESCWYEKHGKKPNKTAHQRFTRMLADKPHLK